MAHADSSWRVGAVYRAFYRWNMSQAVGIAYLEKAFRREGDTPSTALYKAKRSIELWFQADSQGRTHISKRRAEWLEQKKSLKVKLGLANHFNKA